MFKLFSSAIIKNKKLNLKLNEYLWIIKFVNTYMYKL